MTTRNEVLEGIAAFTGVRNALKDDPRGDYYRFLLNRERQNAKEDDDAYARGSGGLKRGAIDTATPGSGFGHMGVDDYGGAVGGYGYTPTIVNERGGMVRRFGGGGLVGGSDPMDDAIMATMDSIPTEEYTGRNAPPVDHSAEHQTAINNTQDGKLTPRPMPRFAERGGDELGDQQRIDPLRDAVADVARYDAKAPAIDSGAEWNLQGHLDRAAGKAPPMRAVPETGGTPEQDEPRPGPTDELRDEPRLSGRSKADRARSLKIGANAQPQPKPKSAISTGTGEVDEMNAQPREVATSAAGRLYDRVFGKTPGYGAIENVQGQIAELLRQRSELEGGEFGVFRKQTPSQRRETALKVAEINQKLAALNEEMKGAAKIRDAAQAHFSGDTLIVDAPKPAQSAPQQSAPADTENSYMKFGQPTATPDRVLNPQLPLPGPEVDGGMPKPALPPTRGATPPSPPGQNLPTGQNGPQTPPSPSGGMGRSPQPAPPPGAAAAGSSDLSQPGEDGRAAAIRRGIIDENGRVLPQRPATAIATGNPAGNPGMDVNGGSGLNSQGSAPDASTNNAAADFQRAQGQLQQAVAGAAQGGAGYTPQQLAAGAGAVSPQTAEKIVRKFGANGRLTRGEAMMAGMVEVYKARLLRGDVAGASKLAFGIVQRANLEAAMHGREAIARLQANDVPGATRSVIAGHDMIPDGIRLTMGPDGQSVIATDLQGKSQQLPMDGRWILAAATGMTNGSLLWGSLNQAAQMVKGTPKVDPEKAQLEKMLLAERIKKLQRSGQGGGTTGVTAQDVLAALNGQPPAQRPQVNVTVDGGGE